MASCALTQGIGRPPCPGATPGAFDTFYLFNTDDVSAYVAGTGSAVSDVTFKVGKGFYQVIATKKSVIAKESLVDDDSSGTSYTPERSSPQTTAITKCGWPNRKKQRNRKSPIPSG